MVFVEQVRVEYVPAYDRFGRRVFVKRVVREVVDVPMAVQQVAVQQVAVQQPPMYVVTRGTAAPRAYGFQRW